MTKTIDEYSYQKGYKNALDYMIALYGAYPEGATVLAVEVVDKAIKFKEVFDNES